MAELTTSILPAGPLLLLRAWEPSAVHPSGPRDLEHMRLGACCSSPALATSLEPKAEGLGWIQLAEISALGEVHQVPSSVTLKAGSCGFGTSENSANEGKETDGAFWCPTQPLPKLLRFRQFVLLHNHHDPLYPAFSPSVIIFNSYTPAMQVSLEQRANEDHQDHPGLDRHHNTCSFGCGETPLWKARKLLCSPPCSSHQDFQLGSLLRCQRSTGALANLPYAG